MSKNLQKCVAGAAGVLALSTGLLTGPAHAADPAAGQALFMQRCAMCHSAEETKKSIGGPSLFGLAGRVPASAPGFAYSAALKKQTAPWTADRLDTFLAAPNKLAPGTRMFTSIADPKQRQDVVAYLMTRKPAP